MTKRLNKLHKGEKGIISLIEDNGPFNRRIRAMGIMPGSEVIVKEIAPLGDPINIIVKGLSIALRNKEAQKIIVQGTFC
ncbi:MAG: hypothetical protein A2381_06785 [Bdellovibrionales bacterium RIFOXYB1_FULL_37_110]|nr:MAG: hypothetical protein A2417_14660 [Bdellovibrionales bacterium RIFOXYC1_FULL_37_79]OFZ57769.1 MAG: hypothetical protein A2381_06785 [Bdellovibrionales bacterium RIFOXYB1_FULL_37_110]OFZ62735.1 MAG: hypothetical protein A2577_16305 [Bdellovibrionales bacterium RIFOXYD1_FULL_36_51]